MQGAVEPLGKIELLVVGKFLVAKHEHGVFVHAGPQRLQRWAITDLAKIDRAHLATEVWRERGNGDSHDASLPENVLGLIRVSNIACTNYLPCGARLQRRD